MSDDIVIIGAARTPQGRARGALAPLTAVQLGATAIAAALAESGLSPEAVSRVLMGQVLQAGAGQNPARQSALAAGIPWSVPAMTLNKVCLSGAVAVVDAVRMLRLGDADVVVAGGQESMTNAPHLLPGSRLGWAYGTVSALDSVAHDGLTDTTDGISMGESTERHVGALGITRAEQDEIAAASHQRAAAARDAGRFAAELAPIEVPGRGGATTLIDDEGVRADSTVDSLARLRPAFSANGTITAGNASPLSDGAAALVLARAAWAREQGAPVLARVVDYGQVAGPDNSLHGQPARAIARALERGGWRADELDHVEINEAFAAVSLQSARDLDLDLAVVNPDGGAIALGHPIGASGARLTVHAAHSVAAGRARRAAIALCGGGGQGEAILLERV
ncbi:acetyl-CoA C-acyltransferase [Yonghaparkia sp. Root332]|uniref:acetyl-CoA C-acyltransferase n=1 Tax=Yonghaparkia sp. Root332 TaxID=1736516 RepID=UPI0006F6CFFE|nr:acetyl-CoA C-acyltransferase [Yonghaparkia sp. Root332]KQV24773.1 acetyl-CoA acetyltransferase [Yonghaparkia sp. Root332]